MSILLSEQPSKIKTTTKLVEVFEPAFAVRLIKVGLLTVKDLVKGYREDAWSALALNQNERLALEAWLHAAGVLKPKKDLIRDRLPAPNPNIVPFERSVLP